MIEAGYIEEVSNQEMDRLLADLDADEHRVERSDADETYRFRHRGSDFGQWCSVLIERRGERVRLIGEGPLEASGRERRVLQPLTAAEWARLQAALTRAEFWRLPSWHDRFGLDGWTWTIEGNRQARYHSSECWCPEPGEPFHDLGRVFLDLAGLEMPAHAR